VGSLTGLGAGAGDATPRALPPTPLSAFARLLSTLSSAPSTSLRSRLDALADNA
jgi:hypothetical protein